MLNKLKALLLSNRFKSFYWRTGMMAVAGFVDLVLENLSVLELSEIVVVIVGLVLGEISKQIHNQLKKAS